MATIQRTYWQGEECTARRVTVECGDQRHHAVEVTAAGRTFYLDDDDGSGWFKVTAGRGSPNVAHRSLPDGSRVVETLGVA